METGGRADFGGNRTRIIFRCRKQQTRHGMEESLWTGRVGSGRPGTSDYNHMLVEGLAMSVTKSVRRMACD